MSMSDSNTPQPITSRVAEFTGNRNIFFELLKINPGVFVFKFGAEWCKPCKMIKKQKSKWVLKSKKTGKVLGTHPTKKAAKSQEAAINISKARAAGHRILRKKAA